MPLARIDLAQGQSAEYRQTIGEVVYGAMIEKLGVPAGDRFQVITEHPAQNFIFDPDYLGIHRSKDCVFIQLTLLAGRTVDQKISLLQSYRTPARLTDVIDAGRPARTIASRRSSAIGRLSGFVVLRRPIKRNM